MSNVNPTSVCRKECPHEDEVIDFDFDDASGKCAGCGATMRVMHPAGPGDGCEYEEARGTADDCECPKCGRILIVEVPT